MRTDCRIDLRFGRKMQMHRLSRDVLQTLQFKTRDRNGSAPLTIVFVDSSYSEVFDNWLRHALSFVGNDLFVFSLDEAMHVKVQGRGLSSLLLNFSGALDELWLLRLEIFEALTDLGVSFVHSDVDAVWMSDPRAYCVGLDVDLAISAGTIWPPEALELWGFVLCCGFFSVRPSSGMKAFFEAVRHAAIVDRDDQAAVNRVLAKAAVGWQSEGLSYDVQVVMGRPFRIYHEVIFGRTRHGFDIALALLPQDLFQRIRRSCEPGFVKHPLTPKEPAAKIAALRDFGCWRD